MVPNENQKPDTSLDEVDAIREEFDAEFKPITSFEISGSSLGHPLGSLPTIRVYVLSESAKQLLTAELKKRDDSRDFPLYKGARIQIVVTGELTHLLSSE